MTWNGYRREPSVIYLIHKKVEKMPKMKTVSSAKKRFALTATGKIKRKHAFKSHILTKKTTKQKRNLTHVAVVDSHNLAAVRKMLVM